MKEFSIETKLMGSVFQLGVVCPNKDQADEFLQMGISEIKRIELLLSEFLPNSTTSRINQYAFEKEVTIDDETFQLIQRCQSISKLSGGCFDITVAPLKQLYQFKNQSFDFPKLQQLKAKLQQVGYQKIELNSKHKSIRFVQANMKISFAAIGKGYASDCVKRIWKNHDLTAGYINASGDLNAFGRKPDSSSYTIGIADPDRPENMLLHVPLQDASVATSGDYIQHFMSNGIRYSHNINPHTGLPLSGIKSVTVFSPGAELSDALATAVYVKGHDAGVDFVNQLPQTHCIIIDDKNQLYFSKDIAYETVE